MKVYYFRVSTTEQNSERQKEDVPTDAKVFEDKCSGSIPFAERPEGAKILKLVSEGQINTLFVHSIDRLGRNNLDVLSTINFLTLNNVNLVSKKEGLQTFIEGKKNEVAALMIGILSTMAEFELSRIKERQREGIAIAKAKGSYVNNGGHRLPEGHDVFFSKPKTKLILKYINEGLSIRKIAKLSDASVSLVVKVVGMLRDSETNIPKKVIVGSPVVVKPKLTKKQQKMQDYLNAPETDEDRKEWERMEREYNK